ncbi:MAG TPA: Rho termination factor N-terminal domain-containing protein, partial [Ilumatobacteraceae bacterium]|nr:Rho termination factor N-terminal domain-containing protein [Ilumatobacteraceae bacterium]
MAADALEQSVLESKDREQLVAIASALGVKSTSRAKKADLIQKILEQTGALPHNNGAAVNNGATTSLADTNGASREAPAALDAEPRRAGEADGASTPAPPARPSGRATGARPVRATPAPAPAPQPAVDEVILG